MHTWTLNKYNFLMGDSLSDPIMIHNIDPFCSRGTSNSKAKKPLRA